MARTSSRTRKRTLVGFDSEDDGKGTPFLWAFTHAAGQWSTTHRSDAVQYVHNIAERERAHKRVAELWATNLEYDLVNLFEPERIRELTLRFGRSALCGASWKGADFRDTLRHVPLSVAELGHWVGLKKVEARLFSTVKHGTIEQYRRRCARDAAITFRAARLFRDTYKRLGERPRMTLASTALNLWRTKYWRQRIGRPAPDVWSAALGAYHGGRTEAFSVGEFGPVTVVDVASMFPWAMTVAPLPLPWGLTRRVGAKAAIQGNGLYDVEVDCQLARPRLPVRTRHGTIYPRGKWRGWYVGEELQATIAAGGKVRVISGVVFCEQVRPFDDYVRTMYAKKHRARGGKRTIYKLLLNALYGKFGQQGKRVYAVPMEQLLTMRDPPLSWRPWNGLAIFSKDGPPPPWGNNVWSAWTTARARIRLAQELDRLGVQGRRLLYCDTDSAMFSGPSPRYPEHASSIGQFERRGTYKRAVIVGKKEYALDVGRGKWEIHVKGVPERERRSYLTRGVATFSRPVRLRESSRLGLPANVWRDVTKVRRTDLKARARPDGELRVPVIAGDPESIRWE